MVVCERPLKEEILSRLPEPLLGSELDVLQS